MGDWRTDGPVGQSAGWYPWAPSTGQQRWWDGEQWRDRYRDGKPAPVKKKGGGPAWYRSLTRAGRAVVWCFAVAAAALTWGIVAQNMDTNGHNRDRARRECEMKVDVQLTDPIDSQYFETVEHKSKHHWVVSGIVRAANEFGGHAPHAFKCDAYNDDPRGWTAYATLR